MYTSIHVTHPLFSSNFHEIEFSRNFSKNTQVSIFMKIRPLRAKVSHADVKKDGQMDRQIWRSR